MFAQQLTNNKLNYMPLARLVPRICRMVFTCALFVILTVAGMSVTLGSLFPSPSPACSAAFQDEPTPRVNEQLTPTGRALRPAGDLISFYGRPVDLRLSVDGRWLFAKSKDSIEVMDTQTWAIAQSISSPGGTSLWGMAVGADHRLYVTNATSQVHVFAPNPENPPTAPFVLERSIQLAEDSFPSGVALSEDQATLYVCLSKKNAVAVVDLTTNQVTKSIDVGVAPLDLVRRQSTLFVSNMGGKRPQAEEPTAPTAPSADTPTLVDERGVASHGTVSMIDLESQQVIHETRVKLQPSTMAVGWQDDSIVVCNSNDDSLSLVHAGGGPASTFVLKPDPKLGFGSMPSAITALDGTGRYAVTLAGNNAVAILQAGADASAPSTLGFVPTAWYPSAVIHDAKYLYVACIKGLGARSERRPLEQGRNSHDHFGSIQRIRLTDLDDKVTLEQWTRNVLELAKVKSILGANERSLESSQDVKPRPVPAKLGEPSVFKHVFYVIKENRTFDQVFGDLPEARGMPELCLFPEKITPNHHALARRFGILDNYYCNGVLSADGHSWATEGNVTPYLERAFGGFNRSYTFGDDPLTYSSSGFVWDHVLAAGYSFRNYGEFDYATPPDGMKYQDIWNTYERGEAIEFKQKIGVEKLRRYSAPNYPGWNMVIPDVLRMDRFLQEFRQFEADGNLPNFILIYLPQDHCGGGVTTESHMADNDLALGRLVEAVSNSKYWKDSVILVNEDDPQGGYDHVDGHRSLCLVISAYSKPGVNSQFCNQTSVLRTMLQIFGVPPMNQQDASMPLMSHCFQETPDLQPYKALAANVPMNQSAPAEEEQSALEKHWRGILATVPIQRTGMKTPVDEENLNRFMWHEVKGWTTTYPAEWSGPHGRGLSGLGLQHDPHAARD